MRPMLFALTACALLSAGCAGRKVVIPSPSIPHQLAEETTVTAWCRAPDRTLVKCRLRVREGWWLASPELVEVPQ